MVAPVIPALTDHEMPSILAAAKKAGARWAGYVALRLPWAVAPLFEQWLAEHFPIARQGAEPRPQLRNGKLMTPSGACAAAVPASLRTRWKRCST
jgi:DNA repair photolyase